MDVLNVDPVEVGFISDLGLTAYRDLQIIKLWLTVHPMAPSVWQQWQAHLRFLRHVPGDVVTEIVVGVLVEDGDPDLMDRVRATKWKLLSTVLPRFPALRTLKVAVVDRNKAAHAETGFEIYEGLQRIMDGPGGVRVVKGEEFAV